MEIRVLRYFLTVAREQNITRAADALHITQPTLSRQMLQLESELGIRLFDRKKRKITLTDEGSLLRKRAETIVEISEKAERELSELSDRVIGGTVSIGTGAYASSCFLADVIAEFKGRHPQVSFEIVTDHTDSILEKMEHGLVDIGLLLGPFWKEGYRALPLSVKERCGLLTRADAFPESKRSVTPEELRNMPIILSGRRVLQKTIAEWLGEHFTRSSIAVTSNLSFNSALLVEKGLGYAFVLEGSVALYSRERYRFLPLEPELAGETLFVWKRQPFTGRTLETFMDFLREKTAGQEGPEDDSLATGNARGAQ